MLLDRKTITEYLTHCGKIRFPPFMCSKCSKVSTSACFHSIQQIKYIHELCVHLGLVCSADSFATIFSLLHFEQHSMNVSYEYPLTGCAIETYTHLKFSINSKQLFLFSIDVMRLQDSVSTSLLSIIEFGHQIITHYSLTLFCLNIFSSFLGT